MKTKKKIPKSTKNHPKKTPPPYEAAPLPHTNMGARCLSAVVLNNQLKVVAKSGKAV